MQRGRSTFNQSRAIKLGVSGALEDTLTTGSIFYVDSNAGPSGRNTGADSANFGQIVSAPFLTWDFAIGQCTANLGDTIYFMPNHAETITGASGITADIAGVSHIGLGKFNQRPRFLMDGGTTVDLVVSAADNFFHNMVFASGHSDVVRCFAIGEAVGCWLDEIEFGDNIADENFLTPIKCIGVLNNSNDGLRVTNCRWLTVDIGSLEFIELEELVDAAVIEDNFVIHEGTASPLILGAAGAGLTRCSVQRNFLSHKMTANELLVNIDTAGSGVIAHNRVRHADVTTTHDLGIDAIGMGLFDNLSVSTDALSGLVLPAIDVNS